MISRLHPYPLWLALSLPAITMLYAAVASSDPQILHDLLEPSGETSARLVIIAMCASPLRQLMPGWKIPAWLLANRRYLGVGSFGYALLHLVFYLTEKGGFMPVVREIGWPFILFGWLAFLFMLPAATTSNRYAQRRLGPNWKILQRVIYIAAFLIFAHWGAVYGLRNVTAVLANFSPLILLTFWRIWKNSRQQ